MDDKVNVLVLGGGGREHALCWKLRQSPLCGELFCSPGNDGIAADASTNAKCVALDGADAVMAFAREHNIGLLVPGPEVVLLDGIVDAAHASGLLAFGPTKAAAMLEGSKGFTKELCARRDIPTARFARFSSRAEAKTYARAQSLPLVVKADGLAAGKGVVIAATHEEAETALDAMFDGAFGEAGSQVVIEEFLEGVEMSFFALADGTSALAFASAQDYKRIGDGDTGPNTGGMGAISPSPLWSAALEDKILRRIIRPTLDDMQERGAAFAGVLYAGLMICQGEPYLIEYNVRFGDPECQGMLVRLESDLLALLLACAKGELASHPPLRWSADASITIVVASEGYPKTFAKGTEIRDWQTAAQQLTALFHAATRRDGETWRANGGRVLNAVAREKTLRAARQKAYTALKSLDWSQGYYRNDIGHDIGNDIEGEK